MKIKVFMAGSVLIALTLAVAIATLLANKVSDTSDIDTDRMTHGTAMNQPAVILNSTTGNSTAGENTTESNIAKWIESIDNLPQSIDQSALQQSLTALGYSDEQVAQKLQRITLAAQTKSLWRDFNKEENSLDNTTRQQYGEFLVARAKQHWQDKSFGMSEFLNLQNDVFKAVATTERQYQQKIEEAKQQLQQDPAFAKPANAYKKKTLEILVKEYEHISP